MEDQLLKNITPPKDYYVNYPTKPVNNFIKYKVVLYVIAGFVLGSFTTAYFFKV